MFEIEELVDVPVVRVSNFLPHAFVERFYEMLAEIQGEFGAPAWSSRFDTLVDSARTRRSLCVATDVWFPALGRDAAGNEVPWVPSLLYELLEQHLFHQGLMEFLRRTQDEVFRLIPCQTPDGRMHIVTYGNGGMYSWHNDSRQSGGPFMFGESPPRNNLFTMSLSLGRSSTMSGGDLLFMRDNRTVRLPFAHNSLAIFPASVYHAATEVTMDPDESWINRRVSCQFWLAGAQSMSSRDYEKYHWPSGPGAVRSNGGSSSTARKNGQGVVGRRLPRAKSGHE